MSFQYVKPDEDQMQMMQKYRDKFEALAAEIELDLPKSRGLSLAMRKLEETALWLNKTITRND